MYQLAGKINWSFFDDAFKKHYSEKRGAPSKRIRLMLSLLILKHVRDLSDENVVKQWSENKLFSILQSVQRLSNVGYLFTIYCKCLLEFVAQNLKLTF